jgi:hypothetical protein
MRGRILPFPSVTVRARRRGRSCTGMRLYVRSTIPKGAEVDTTSLVCSVECAYAGVAVRNCCVFNKV